MKQLLFTVIGSFLLFTGTNASGNTSEKSSASVIVKPAVAPQCNFAFLRGHRKGSGAALQWGMDGAGATKFIISRTYEFDPYDPYAVWEDAGTVAADNSRQYGFTDNSVFPGTIYYKVTAVMADGSTVCSDLKAIQITQKR